MSSEVNVRHSEDQLLNHLAHPAAAKKGASNRGFASMNAKQQREIASKGGEAVSKNREHMAEIGKKGGEIVSQNRKHMSQIGRKGGEASRASRNR